MAVNAFIPVGEFITVIIRTVHAIFITCA